MSHCILLKDMRAHQEGTVLEILGGSGLAQRLKSIGIRPGVKIIRTGRSSGKGPIIVRLAAAQIALGFKMSDKISVEVKA